VQQKAVENSAYSCATLRFLVDAEREITVPVGVILWSAEEGRIWFRLPREGERIKDVPLAAACSTLDLVRSQIEGWHRLEQLPYAKDTLQPLSAAWWNQVRRLLQWSVRLGPTSVLDVEDPQEELEALYRRVVKPARTARRGRVQLPSPT
jgi:hypothetical protein